MNSIELNSTPITQQSFYNAKCSYIYLKRSISKMYKELQCTKIRIIRNTMNKATFKRPSLELNAFIGQETELLNRSLDTTERTGQTRNGNITNKANAT